ncbi:unnamed protein product [Ectocarpus sp. 6 AP-2014]
MALVGEEPSYAQSMSSSENGTAALGGGSTKAVEPKRATADSTRSEMSSNGEQSAGVSAPTLPTKRTVRQLLETRNTLNKMEIGQGVLLTADVTGAELVVIRGCFEGKVTAQCIDIEQGAEVRGTIECEAARVNGKFDGVFMSSHSLHLASHANVSGRIIYRRLKVAKGAQLYGLSEYRSPVLAK